MGSGTVLVYPEKPEDHRHHRPMNDRELLGVQVEDRRKIAKLSRQDISLATQLSERCISDLELGKRRANRITVEKLLQISLVIGCIPQITTKIEYGDTTTLRTLFGFGAKFLLTDI
jgi:transcriptional regulator with XRE-family HTH domain